MGSPEGLNRQPPTRPLGRVGAEDPELCAQQDSANVESTAEAPLPHKLYMSSN